MRVPIDAARFAAAGLDFQREGSDGVFRLVIDAATSPHVLVRVQVDADAVVFLPQRSAAQRQVLGLLGETIPAFG